LNIFSFLMLISISKKCSQIKQQLLFQKNIIYLFFFDFFVFFVANFFFFSYLKMATTLVKML